MSTGWKTQKSTKNRGGPPALVTANVGNRNLSKFHLGGVIFGCRHNTITECLSKQLFGLPSQHFSYVQNIHPGLPLFLFNYSDRKLHGIYEAASPGQMNINPYGWNTDGLGKTLYPAQVQIRVRRQCQPLLENQFKPILADNYHSYNHFWFELDHAQTNKLISLLTSQVVTCSVPHISTKVSTGLPSTRTGYKSEMIKPQTLEVEHFDPSSQISDSGDVALSLDAENRAFEANFDPNVAEKEEQYHILLKLQRLALNRESPNLPSTNDIGDTTVNKSGEPIESKEHNEEASGSDLSLTSDIDDTTLNKDTNLENNGRSDELIESKEHNEKAFCSDFPLTGDIDDTTLNKDMNIENSCRSVELTEPKEHSEKAFGSLAECQSLMAKLVQVVQELKDSNTKQAQRINCLETKLLETEGQVQELKDRMMLGSLSNSSAVEVDRTVVKPLEYHLDPNDSIFLIGGYDGESWLSSFDLYDPSRDVIKSLRPMSSVRSYASVVRFKSKPYVIGGGNGYDWYDTVESYSSENDQWTSCPSLNVKRGSLGGVTIDNKLFALGGGNGVDCFSDVEMLDLDVGRWIRTRSMLQRRFAVAAVELKGVVYATGGFDGNDYLNSVERFDIREHSWTQIRSMNAKRGCHSLVTLNEKLYAIGGFDGSSMVSSVEVYDPRLDLWIGEEPMKNPRGYAAASIVDESIYVIGGIKYGETIIESVENFKEGCGWQEKTSKVLKKRCFLSATASD